MTVLKHEQVSLTPEGVNLGGLHPETFDLIWLLGFGKRESCADRFQILSQLNATQFITPPLTMISLHSKFALQQGPLQQFVPDTWVSDDLDWLKAKIFEGGEWVVKPTAGSYGREVFRISGNSPNLSVILETLTKNGYCILQPYLASVEQGEKRILIANSTLIGCYKRTTSEKFRTNLSNGANVSECSLSDKELNMVEQAIQYFASAKVGFASIDLVGGYIMEINVANPGGLQTLASLKAKDFALNTALSFV